MRSGGGEVERFTSGSLPLEENDFAESIQG